MRNSRASIAIAATLLLSCFNLVASASTPTGDGWSKRCGWWNNPTPSNVWFVDKDGEWTVSQQGGWMKPVEGATKDKDGFAPMEMRPYPLIEDDNVKWPEFKRGQKVKTNGEYGYGCVCASMQVSHTERVVVSVKNAIVRPLSACRKYPALAKH